MTDAPERITVWIDYDGTFDGKWVDAGIPSPPPFQGGEPEYVRADLLEARAALIAEARQIVASQLEALEEFGITGGAMPEARAFMDKTA